MGTPHKLLCGLTQRYTKKTISGWKLTKMIDLLLEPGVDFFQMHEPADSGLGLCHRITPSENKAKRSQL